MGDKNVLELDDDGCRCLQIYEDHLIVHIKGVNFVMCEFILD